MFFKGVFFKGTFFGGVFPPWYGSIVTAVAEYIYFARHKLRR